MCACMLACVRACIHVFYRSFMNDRNSLFQKRERQRYSRRQVQKSGNKQLPRVAGSSVLKTGNVQCKMSPHIAANLDKSHQNFRSQSLQIMLSCFAFRFVPRLMCVGLGMRLLCIQETLLLSKQTLLDEFLQDMDRVLPLAQVPS